MLGCIGHQYSYFSITETDIEKKRTCSFSLNVSGKSETDTCSLDFQELVKLHPKNRFESHSLLLSKELPKFSFLISDTAYSSTLTSQSTGTLYGKSKTVLQLFYLSPCLWPHVLNTFLTVPLASAQHQISAKASITATAKC